MNILHSLLNSFKSSAAVAPSPDPVEGGGSLLLRPIDANDSPGLDNIPSRQNLFFLDFYRLSSLRYQILQLDRLALDITKVGGAGTPVFLKLGRAGDSILIIHDPSVQTMSALPSQFHRELVDASMVILNGVVAKERTGTLMGKPIESVMEVSGIPDPKSHPSVPPPAYMHFAAPANATSTPH